MSQKRKRRPTKSKIEDEPTAILLPKSLVSIKEELDLDNNETNGTPNPELQVKEGSFRCKKEAQYEEDYSFGSLERLDFPTITTAPTWTARRRKIRDWVLNDNDDPAYSEEFLEESDIDSQDELEERETDSESEQECEEGVQLEVPTCDFYLGKDGKTKWLKNNSAEKRPIDTHPPDVKEDAMNARTAIESWKCLFTDAILAKIVYFTNQYIDIVKCRFKRERDIKNTDATEITAFIGLLYLAGAYRESRLTLLELWGKDGDGIEKFSLVMSVKRFKILLRCLRFDDQTTRLERKLFDRLAPIREIFEMFVDNCHKNYCMSENATVDEMLLSVKSKCSFRHSIPSKSTNCGIKCFAMVDSKMCYTANMEIYVGQQPEGPFNVPNSPCDVVLRLANPIFQSGRNITADSWFTSIDLVEKLKQNGLTYVGTVKKTKSELPLAFTTEKNQYSTVFGFHEGKVLVSYSPKPQKNVIVVSSLPEDEELNNLGQKPPEILNYYKQTKNEVDTLDESCARYTVRRNVKRWPMIIFFTMLNVAGINSQIIYLLNGLEPLKRRAYLKTLAHQLVVGELSRRSMKKFGVPGDLRNRLTKFRPTEEEAETHNPLLPPKRRRCVTCNTENNYRRMSTHECVTCHKSICLTHAITFCKTCSLGPPPTDYNSDDSL